MPLAIVIGMTIRVFTTTATSLAPRNHIQCTCSLHSSHEASGVHHPLSGIESLHACCFPGAGFLFGHVLSLDEKASTSCLFAHFDHLIQVGQIHCLVCSSFPLNGKSCLSLTSQQSGYPQSMQGNWQFINFTFHEHLGDLIDGGCTQSNWLLRIQSQYSVWYN